MLRQHRSNAVVHTDCETPQVDATVESSPGSDAVTIADRGVGIADARMRRLQVPDAREHEQSGRGSGLLLVLSLLDRIDADGAFAGDEPSGTEVTVTLDRVGPT